MRLTSNFAPSVVFNSIKASIHREILHNFWERIDTVQKWVKESNQIWNLPIEKTQVITNAKHTILFTIKILTFAYQYIFYRRKLINFCSYNIKFQKEIDIYLVKTKRNKRNMLHFWIKRDNERQTGRPS